MADRDHEYKTPVGDKGAPAHEDTPAREWTCLDVDEERNLLERQLSEAQGRNDDCEVKRIEARLRLLDPGA